MAVGALSNIAVAAAAINFARVRRSMGYMAFPARNHFLVFRVAVDTRRYILIVFAVVHRKVIVNISVAGSAHLFCQGAFERCIFDGNMWVAVAAEADASIPLRAV